MTPQDARTIANYLVADLQQEIPTTIRVLEAATGKLDYAPDAKSMNGLALTRHIVQIDAWFLNSVADGAFDGSKIDMTDTCGIANGTEGAAKYKDVVGSALNRVSAMSDAKLAEDIDFFGMMKLPAVNLLGLMIKHSVHHRGQLSAYLRSMGSKVPGIYGPSGDSQ